MINEKAELEKRKKAAEDAAAQKELERDRKIRPIGNYVHESVPVSNNEARSSSTAFLSLCYQANCGHEHRMTTK